ncbi:MAG: transcriptional regulator, partial [Rhodospirillaceae bacterium]|nr:transcriptional regulator [Rhodospirillaceae bacterium]
PYALGVIALDAGPSMIAQLADWDADSLKCGMPVEMTIGTIRTGKDGIRHVGPKFRPLDERTA